MEAITIYRALRSVIEGCNLSDEGSLSVLDMMDINSHPMVVTSKKEYIFNEFKRFFKEDLKEGIMISNKEDNDLGYSYVKKHFLSRISEMLQLNETDKNKLFDSKEEYMRIFHESISRDSFRSMYFLLFSLFSNGQHAEKLISFLQKYKPTYSCEYPTSFNQYENIVKEKIDLENDGYQNICDLMKSEEEEIYQLWINNIPVDLYKFVMSNPAFWSDYKYGSMKVFRVNPLGMELKKSERPGFYWDCLMAMITGHKISLKDKGMNWQIETLDKQGLSFMITNGNKLNFKSDSFIKFINTPFNGRTVGSIIKNIDTVRIFC